ncbi:MAG TPA: hypothetical protein VNW29_02910 [Candidatus Sulfotelmatobacter sp.]|jgi:hypothetical protein|nr:hypothetical protein [Candidatus Sulfotelmatobacter sp.]
MKNLTLKRILKRHKENPQDQDLHQVIVNDNSDDKEFDELVKEATKHEAFDKK